MSGARPKGPEKQSAVASPKRLLDRGDAGGDRLSREAAELVSAVASHPFKFPYKIRLVPRV